MAGGHGDDELFSDEDAIAWFDVRDVVRAPARLDWAKLNHINNHYIRRADDERLTGLVMHDLNARAFDLPSDAKARLLAVTPMVKDGAKTIRELSDLSVFALKRRPLALDAKGLALLTDDVRALLLRLTAALRSQDDWAPAPLTSALRQFAASEGVGLGKFGAPLRAVLSGGAPAPDLAGALAALGKSESLGRLEDALSQLR